MDNRRSHASSRQRLSGSGWLGLALAALLALPPAAFAAPRGSNWSRKLNALGSATAAQVGVLYRVNTTGDAAGVGLVSRCDTDILTPGDQCTLRAALRATNGVAGVDIIEFGIPATDPGCDPATGRCVINLTQALPDITEGVSIEGPGDAQGRAAALGSVVESAPVYKALYNPAFVLMQYFGYLRRNPDDEPDFNFDGYDFWLAKMDSFSLPGEDVRDEPTALRRVRRAEMVRAFIISDEYRKRFGP